MVSSALWLYEDFWLGDIVVSSLGKTIEAGEAGKKNDGKIKRVSPLPDLWS
jgi:hypothetical protein